MLFMPLGGGSAVRATVSLLALALSLSCSGESMDGEPAAAGAGGMLPASGGAGGTSGSSAGAGAGGLMIVGGAAGASPSGGTGAIIEPGCPECPDGSYGVVVQGDGEELRMTRNAAATGACTAEPLRGSRAGCGGSAVYFSACADAAEASSCLVVSGSEARYTDRAGTLWVGSVSEVAHDVAPAQVDSGTVTLSLTAGGEALELTVDYAFCIGGAFVRIVCR